MQSHKQKMVIVKKTAAAIVRTSKSAAGVEDIVENFDLKTKLHKISDAHTSRASEDDENMMIKVLRKLQTAFFIHHQEDVRQTLLTLKHYH